MQPILIKAYGSLYPACTQTLHAVEVILADWHITDAAELEKDLLRISYEGSHFPGEDVVQALHPWLQESSRGKLDVLDLEAWQLERYIFDYGRVQKRQASLNQALDTCSR